MVVFFIESITINIFIKYICIRTIIRNIGVWFLNWNNISNKNTIKANRIKIETKTELRKVKVDNVNKLILPTNSRLIIIK